MEAKAEQHQKWWQQLKKHRVAIGVVAIVLAVVIVLIIVGYRFDWTGFNGNNKSGKTLWDWMQLLIIPLALAVIALVFQLANARTERQIAKERYEQDQRIVKQRYEQDQQIALDKQRENLLQTYLDRMSELLIEKNLLSSQLDSVVRNVARARTITILNQLDARRIGYVFAFLCESGLMSAKSNSSIVSLKEADLKKFNFSQANLSRADLRKANLSGANFSSANLSGANLSEAHFYDMLEHGRTFHFRSVPLNADFKADLSGALLLNANLSRAELFGANLRGANLISANLTGAKLVEADLRGANL